MLMENITELTNKVREQIHILMILEANINKENIKYYNLKGIKYILSKKLNKKPTEF